MIHFFPIFSRNAADTPFGEALRATGAAHRIFAEELSFRYSSRLELLFVCIPRLAWFAIRSARQSLWRADPRPEAVVLGSDIEVLIFAVARALAPARPRIVLNTFIFTRRASAFANALRTRYYRLVLSCADIVLVHSRREVELYARTFPGLRTRFAFVPYGLHVDDREALLAAGAAAPAGRPVIVTAGKSGRDYATLFQAMVGLDAELRVICDLPEKVPPVPPGAHVTVLSSCHGRAYLTELAQAALVVVPVEVSDISAGQMVLIQAMCLGRPVIVTDTPTVRDYATDGEDAILVPIRDAAAMQAAIRRVLTDDALRARLSAAAAARFDSSHNNAHFVQRMVDVIAAPPA